MTDNKIVWVAGMPRAGSMWTCNVARGLLLAGGKDVQPQFVPRSDREVSALAAATDMAVTVDHYNSFPSSLILHLDYRDIVASPREVCRKIAQFLSIEVTDVETDSVAERYSRRNVSSAVSWKERAVSEYFRLNKSMPESDVVRNFDNSLRVYDSATGFQSGHVSGYRDGDWRTLLTSQQRKKLYAELGEWLDSRGYLR